MENPGKTGEDACMLQKSQELKRHKEGTRMAKRAMKEWYEAMTTFKNSSELYKVLLRVQSKR